MYCKVAKKGGKLVWDNPTKKFPTKVGKSVGKGGQKQSSENVIKK